jgi:hypothetical protein
VMSYPIPTALYLIANVVEDSPFVYAGLRGRFLRARRTQRRLRALHPVSPIMSTRF